MTKWFDTNYHYMVPEFARGPEIRAGLAQADRGIRGGEGAWLSDAARADWSGHVPKTRQERRCRLRSAVAAGPACCRSMSMCFANFQTPAPNGCRSTSPCLVLDLDGRRARCAAPGLCDRAARAARPEDHADDLFRRPGRQPRYRAGASVAGLTSTSCARRNQFDDVAEEGAAADLVLSLGVIDGRNIWRANLPALLDRLEPIVARRGAGPVSNRAVLFAAACSDRSRSGTEP